MRLPSLTLVHDGSVMAGGVFADQTSQPPLQHTLPCAYLQRCRATEVTGIHTRLQGNHSIKYSGPNHTRRSHVGTCASGYFDEMVAEL